jgi:hypothetical protein
LISVRKEWEAAETDTDKLGWAEKWGDLLMETYQNPIWTAGHTQGTKEVLALVSNIRKGKVPDIPLPEELQQYVTDVVTLAKSLKTISFSIKVEESALPNLDEDKISNSSMSLDQPQAQPSGMIIDEEDLDESLMCENSY